MYAGEVSREAQGFIKNLLVSNDHRLGNFESLKRKYPSLSRKPEPPVASDEFTDLLNIMMEGGDASEVKRHPWFSGIDFNRLREKTPPWVPQLSTDADTRYFDESVRESGIDDQFASITVHGGEKGKQTEPLPNLHETSMQSLPVSEIVEEEDPIELRKKLAFKGFTYKSVPSTNTYIKHVTKQQEK